MPVNIRLMRMGAKGKPFYRIVAADSRRARDGRFLEIVGTYNPVTKPAIIKVHEDKITNWLNDGAQTTPTVGSLLTQIGFIEKYEKAKRGEDVSEIAVKEHITERKKKTRKMKKAVLAEVEAAKLAESEKAKAEKEAAKAAEEAAKAAADESNKTEDAAE